MMTDQPTLTMQRLVSALAAERTGATIQTLTAIGMPLGAILSGILGEAVRTFAHDQGWEEAAALCDELARQARALARPGASELAAAQPAGRA